MNSKIDVLAVMEMAAGAMRKSDLTYSSGKVLEAHAAVAELIKAAQRMESAVGGGARCEARAMLRSALAKIGA